MEGQESKWKRIYYDADADLNELKGKVIGIVGYGNQGRAHALSMKAMGLDVVVGAIRDQYWDRAVTDGFKPVSVDECARKSDVLCFMVPDEVQPEVYESGIKPNLRPGMVLDFSSGFNIAYQLIEPPKDIDVVMVAPRMPGPAMLELFNAGSGAVSFIGVYQDYSKKAKQITLALAKSIGSTRVGSVWTTFEEEVESDLFFEQCFWGPVLKLFQYGFELLMEKGYTPEIAALEMNASGENVEVMKLAAQQGVWGQLRNHSLASQYGQLTKGEVLIKPEIKEEMGRILEKIKNGDFARELLLEKSSHYTRLKSEYKLMDNHILALTEQELRRRLKHNKREK